MYAHLSASEPLFTRLIILSMLIVVISVSLMSDIVCRFGIPQGAIILLFVFESTGNGPELRVIHSSGATTVDWTTGDEA